MHGALALNSPFSSPFSHLFFLPFFRWLLRLRLRLRERRGLRELRRELRELLERSAPRGLDWQELLERIDVNNDGKITWQEFDQAVRSGNAVWHEMGQPHGETTPSVAIGAFGEFEVSPSSPHMLPS